MRSTPAVSLLLVLACACQTEQEKSQLDGIAAMRSGEAIRNASIERAIVAQRTLYPFHFVAGSSELNELGRRDLGVLARHLAGSGGAIVLAPASEPGAGDDALQRARGQRVVALLQELGVPKERAKLSDGLPGGDGISGARLVEILEKPSGMLSAGTSTGGGRSSGAGVGVQP